MTIFSLIFLVIIGLAVYLWTIYNQLVTLKTRIRASIQEIGNQLKRQSELIPNLVASVKGYIEHEKDVFEKLTDARKAVMEALGTQNTQKIVDAGSRLQEALAPIRVVLESNPQLQAAGPTSQLMEELRDTADKVMYSRRTLIDLTADYNIKITVFPSNLVAKVFKFMPETGIKVNENGEQLQVADSETKTPRVEL